MRARKGRGTRKRAQKGRRDKEDARVVKPRLQIYDIELEVRRTLEAGANKI